MRVQGKVRVTGNGEVVHSESVEQLARIQLVWDCARRADLGKAVGHKEDEDDEQAVGGTLDLKVAEERVRAE